MFHRFQTRKVIVLVLVLGIGLLAYLALSFGAQTSSASTQAYVYADGYYDAAGGAYIFGGARSDMSSAVPQVRDGSTGFSAMRVAVAHKTLSDPNPDYAFVETGWVKYGSSSSRCVYASWRTTGGLDGYYQYTCLPNGTTGARDYRVAVKNDNQTQWSFIFDGVVFRTTAPGFTRGAEVGCGGEASSSANAIGVSSCYSVKYKNNALTSWVQLPSHLKRVTAG
ncbi:hypothetical protein, partial [Promineifilum sp.]|uniref:hypothetical protein n=1 Tax=Promineifilum sp. TaxID=2664178 RepID=UPI0035B35E4A